MIRQPETRPTEADAAIEAFVDASGLSYDEAVRAQEAGIDDPLDPALLELPEVPAGSDPARRTQALYLALRTLAVRSRLDGFLRNGNHGQYGQRRGEVLFNAAAKYARTGATVRPAFMAANDHVRDPLLLQRRWRTFYERYRGTDRANDRHLYMEQLREAAAAYDVDLPEVE